MRNYICKEASPGQQDHGCGAKWAVDTVAPGRKAAEKQLHNQRWTAWR